MWTFITRETPTIRSNVPDITNAEAIAMTPAAMKAIPAIFLI
jgi:hypothetical protein